MELAATDTGRDERRARALERLARALSLLGSAAIALCVLAWNDVVPGGWRLRNAFEHDSEREARETRRHALERLALFAREEPPTEGAIVFLGSSTIERFPLAELFPGKPCVNRGIANASARMLAPLVEHLLPPAPPAGLVVYAGAVDWRTSRGNLASTLAAIEALLGTLRARLPDVPIVLLGPLPERGLARAAEADPRDLESALAARAAAGGARPADPFFRVTLLPLARPPVATSAGALSERFSVDRLHLNKDGYRQVAAWIQAHGSEVGRRLTP